MSSVPVNKDDGSNSPNYQAIMSQRGVDRINPMELMQSTNTPPPPVTMKLATGETVTLQPGSSAPIRGTEEKPTHVSSGENVNVLVEVGGRITEKPSAVALSEAVQPLTAEDFESPLTLEPSTPLLHPPRRGRKRGPKPRESIAPNVASILVQYIPMAGVKLPFHCIEVIVTEELITLIMPLNGTELTPERKQEFQLIYQNKTYDCMGTGISAELTQFGLYVTHFFAQAVK